MVIEERNIKLQAHAENWEEALKISGSLLVDSGYIEEKYVEMTIDTVKEMGPYIVIGPGLALAHSRPDASVLKTGISLITLDEAINVMHCNEWQATIAKIIDTLNYFGLEHSEEIFYTCGEPDVTLPKCAIILEKMGRFSHYLVAFDGKYYDSNLGVLEEYDMTKLLGYLEVNV